MIRTTSVTYSLLICHRQTDWATSTPSPSGPTIPKSPSPSPKPRSPSSPSATTIIPWLFSLIPDVADITIRLAQSSQYDFHPELRDVKRQSTTEGNPIRLGILTPVPEYHTLAMQWETTVPSGFEGTKHCPKMVVSPCSCWQPPARERGTYMLTFYEEENP